MDNVALTTKLKAGREVEAQQKGRITTLQERLVQALKAEVSIHISDTFIHRVQRCCSTGWSCNIQATAAQEMSVLTSEKSHLEHEIKVLERTLSILQTEWTNLNELIQMDILKGSGDGDVTERVVEILRVFKDMPRKSGAAKRYETYI